MESAAGTATDDVDEGHFEVFCQRLVVKGTS